MAIVLKRQVLRKLALGGALAATIYASVDTGEAPLAPMSEAVSPQAASPLVAAPSPAIDMGSHEFVEEGGQVDPFAPRRWVAAAATIEQRPAAPAAPAVAPVVLAAGPPELPFRFVGSMQDGDEQVVYLGRGDQALIVRAGEVVESTYKVVSINVGQIEFEHLPTGQKQTLSLPKREN